MGGAFVVVIVDLDCQALPCLVGSCVVERLTPRGFLLLLYVGWLLFCGVSVICLGCLRRVGDKLFTYFDVILARRVSLSVPAVSP